MSNLDYSSQVAKIKVFGVGGAGTNAVNRMVEEGLQGVDFYVANTDLQSLTTSPIENKNPIRSSTHKWSWSWT